VHSKRILELKSSTSGLKLPAASAGNGASLVPPQGATRARTSGFVFQNYVACPELGADDLAAISSTDIRTITRHIEKQYLESARSGYFRFGTIESYRAKEAGIDGRFGDRTDGVQSDVVYSKSGKYNVIFNGNLVSAGRMSGVDDPVVFRTIANEYCSCSSIGIYDARRAALLISSGNNDIEAFVTYDVEALKAAIMEILSERHQKTLRLLGRPVEYRKKDRRWQIEDSFERQDNRDQLNLYLETAFVKVPDFKHEEEFRLLLLDPSAPGRLSVADEAVTIFNDARIVAAIRDSGTFTSDGTPCRDSRATQHAVENLP